KGPTVFNTIWDSLEAVVYKDEFANAKNNVGWPDDPVLLEALLKDSAYSFADNINTTNKKETIADCMMEAIKRATAALQSIDQSGNLAWGK
ncbi:penicillin acylase family protein, partial [Staphylococcus aureus]